MSSSSSEVRRRGGALNDLRSGPSRLQEGLECRADSKRLQTKMKVATSGRATALPLKQIDWRLLLVYVLLLLDVVVLGATALQHLWQPSALVEKLLQTHAASLDTAAMNRQLLHEQLERRLPWTLPSQEEVIDFMERQRREVLAMPLAVKRELGLSCCCGWLALAAMGLLSLALSLGGDRTSENHQGRAPQEPGSSTDSLEGGEEEEDEEDEETNSLGYRSAASSPCMRVRAKREEGLPSSILSSSFQNDSRNERCRVCGRLRDALEVEAKLKAVLIAIFSFLVFFGFNLSIQLHSRYAQAKVVASSLGSLAVAAAEHGSAEKIANLKAGSKEAVFDPSNGSSTHGTETETKGEDSETLPLQSPLYSPWDDAFFWGEVIRDFVADPEIQVSILWLSLHAAALLLGRRLIADRDRRHYVLKV